MENDPVLTVQQVAQRLQVSTFTVRRWLKTGDLKGAMLGGSKVGYRIQESELRRFMQARGFA